MCASGREISDPTVIDLVGHDASNYTDIRNGTLIPKRVLPLKRGEVLINRCVYHAAIISKVSR